LQPNNQDLLAIRRIAKLERVREAAEALDKAWGLIGNTMTVGSPYAADLHAALAALKALDNTD